MAKKGGKSSGKVSLGGRQRRNVKHEEKRQAYFAKKREEGKAYKYTKNPYKEGTTEYMEEKLIRAEKAKSSKLRYARMQSVFAKLDNYLNAQKLKMKNSEKNVKKAAKA